ncbi:helix-turn-helix domain-containing protein [Natrinema sp. DC36]|uniref:helix-turn-helix domain-containing protein n=1 Tax=Natrinema sp. DC36 TaxID=2878680 RepID=UPI001CEFEB47|nr:helix-turn-helix domain-containing protein [Natrinema sp. DC36]
MSSDAHLGGDTLPDPLSDVPTECYEILRHPRRLRILEVLGIRGARLSLPELTTELIDRTELSPSNGRARHDVRITLVHNHLPRLADYEIVDWDENGVALVDDSPVHPADLAALLELCEADHAEGLLEAIVDPVRMRLLAALEDDDRPLSLEQLAARLSAHDGGPFSDPDRAAVALHHSHLPALSDAGVVNYDSESKLVTRSDGVVSIVQ